MNKKIYAVMSSAALTTVLTAAVSSTAFAAVDAFLVKNEKGLLVQYKYREIMNGAYNDFLGEESPLFDEYSKGTLVAFHDDQTGYVTEKAVMNEAYKKFQEEEEFNLNKFTEAAKGDQILNVKDKEIVERSIDKDGKIVEKVIKEAVKGLEIKEVSAINKTGVTVKFAALEKDMTGVTIQVKDPAGNMVAVVPQNLVKGATTAKFPFTTVPSEIKAGNWTVEGQTFTILSPNAKLSGLTFDKGIWDKDFKDIEQAYNVYVGSDVDTVNITPVADAGATLTAKITMENESKTIVLDNRKENTIKLGNAAGLTEIEITVIAPNKTVNETYKVDIVKANANANNDANLTGLTVNAINEKDGQDNKGKGVIVFKPATTEYSAAVKNSVKSVKVTPTGAAADKIFVNGKEVKTGTNSDAIDLAVGNNEIEVKVIAKDQVTVKIYKITINKAAETASNVRTLNSLTLSAGTLKGFNADADDKDKETGYDGSDDNNIALSTTVANTIQDLTITPVATNANALVEVNAQDSQNNNLEVVKNGASYTIKGLKEGAIKNNIIIKVTPENANEALTYTLTVTRASATASDVAQLTALSFSTDNKAVNDTKKLDGFKTLTTEYVKNVNNDQTNFGFEVTTSDKSTVEAKVNGVSITPKGKIYAGNLKIGENIITIKVTAENGVATRTYTLKVNRADVTASAVKTLNSLGLSAGELAGFKADSNEGAERLTAKVANSVKDLTITPVATDAKAIVEVTAVNNGAKLEVVKNGASYTIKGLKEDANNVITIKVTPEDPSKAQDYTLTVTRVPSNANDNAFLAGENGLQLLGNPDKIEIPGYKADTTSYTVNTAYTNNKVTVTPTTADKVNSIVTVNGKVVGSGQKSEEIPLAVGQNKIEVKVTAENGTTTKTYTVIINRAAETASDVSTLKSLTLSAGTLSGFEADNAVKNEFSTSVLNSVKDLTITPVATNAKAKVVVTATDVANKELTVEAKNGAYTVKGLSEGKNKIQVKVTAEDGIKSTTYTLTANRVVQGANIIAKLKGLVVNDSSKSKKIDLSPEFAQDNTDYKVYVDNGQKNVFIKPTLDETAEGATITIDGKFIENDAQKEVPVSIGDNKFAITITAADLTTTKTYNVDVIRASASASKDATLSEITAVNPGKLNETFNNSTTKYTANVSYLVSTFKFKPVATDKNTRITVKVGQEGKPLVKNEDGSYTVSGLKEGENVIKINTIAEDNSSPGEYTITVIKGKRPDNVEPSSH